MIRGGARVLLHAAGPEPLAGALAEAGLSVEKIEDARTILERLDERGHDVLVIALGPFDAAAEALVGDVARRAPGTGIVVVATRGSVADAVSAVRAGAGDFLVAPAEHEVVRAVEAVLHRAEPVEAVDSPPAGRLLGESAAMQRVHGLLRKAAASSATVLVRGESGTGKELAARALHELGDRARA